MPRNMTPDYMIPDYSIPDLEPPLMTSASADQDKRLVQWRTSYGMRRRALRRIADFGLGATGAGMALASVVFAFAMMKADIPDPTFGGSEYLLLFTRPLHPPGAPNGAPSTQTANRSSHPNIDFMATGAIRPLTRPADGAGDVPQGPRIPLKDYVLRSVRGGIATISGPGGHFIVESGSLMPNGDQVLSIDRRGGHWVVVTSAGIIEDQ
jgi:hypothetical protein